METYRKTRGVSQKDPTYLHIVPPLLFHVIWFMASFEVVPFWLNNTLPTPFPLLKQLWYSLFGDAFKQCVALVSNLFQSCWLVSRKTFALKLLRIIWKIWTMMKTVLKKVIQIVSLRLWSRNQESIFAVEACIVA